MLGALGLVLVNISICVVLGAVVGYLCRGRVGAELAITFVLTLGLFLLFAWRAGWGSVHWTSEEISGAVHEMIGPFLYFYLVPAALTAFVVGRWRRRRYQE